MSHFTTIRTKMIDQQHLLAALRDLGFNTVETQTTPSTLFGYKGDARPEMAEIIIRRQYIGGLSNDIGFAKSADGTFQAIISGYDRGRYSQSWLQKVQCRYAYHATKEALSSEGFSLVEEEQQQDGTLHLVLRRSV
jgi:hypothetical protein